MAYKYTLLIEARGRGPREATIIEFTDRSMRKVCNDLLEHGTKVTIKNREPIKI